MTWSSRNCAVLPIRDARPVRAVLTDTKNAYLRVAALRQARASRTSASGHLRQRGQLPKVENMDMQYSQAAVFTRPISPFRTTPSPRRPRRTPR